MHRGPRIIQRDCNKLYLLSLLTVIIILLYIDNKLYNTCGCILINNDVLVFVETGVLRYYLAWG